MSTDKQKILNQKAREATGKILYSLISGAILANDAIKFFPRNIEETSVKIAWHAILHFDADEEIRQKDSDYAQEQLKYLELLSKILSQGKELPSNMLEEYENLYIDTIMPKRYDFWGTIKALFRFLE